MHCSNMVHPALAHVGVRGIRGALAGGAAGFVLAIVASAVGLVMGGHEPELTYNYKGTTLTFKNLDSMSDLNMDEDLTTIDQYKSYNINAHGIACKAVQRFIDFHSQYVRDNQLMRDCTVHIARMHKAAKRADSNFRRLLYSLKEINFVVAADDVEQASMELHVSFEKVIALAREESLIRDGEISAEP
jgi:hypothetical protein